MNKLSHKQLADNSYFLSTRYTKGSKLYKIYRKMYRQELFKSIIKFEWLFNPKNFWIKSNDNFQLSEDGWLGEGDWDATEYGYTIDETGYKKIDND